MKASESNVQSRVRLEAAKLNWRLFRNNSGAGALENGSFVRWGLGNDSEQVNKVMKSSDLIGWRPVRITSEMIGQTIAQFVAIECKAEGWKYKNNAHEKAQKRFIDMVLADGGYAKFLADPKQLTGEIHV